MSLIDEESDSDLFERLYKCYRQKMFLVARNVLRNDADAEEAVHDVFLCLAQNQLSGLKVIPKEDARRNYLLTAARNRALNKLESVQKLREIPTSPEDIPEPKPLRPVSDPVFSQVCANQTLERLTASLKTMNPLYRDVLYLHFVRRLSTREIAKLSGCSIGAARKRLQRGKECLMKAINSEGEEDEQQ